MDNKNEEFIKKAKNIHGDIYDYSLVDYKNNRTKIKIICPKHGIFEQTPDKHINRKQGCPVCGGTKKLSKEEFLEKAKILYNELFEYSLLNFKNVHDHITIICTKHGEFKEKPYIHLNSNTCEGCKKEKILNNYINECSIIHDNKYDYTLIKNYINCYEKVEIICPEHGIFLQALHSHKQGVGCPKCHIDKITKDETKEKRKRKIIPKIKKEYILKEIKNKNILNNYIEECNKIHNNKFDYSLVKYDGKFNKIKIICPKHGIFLQDASSHKNGIGCFLCSSNKSNSEEFILKANKIHNNLYDYNLVDYKNNKTKVIIICHRHGEFEQQPNNHLNGQGCEKCMRESRILPITSFILRSNIIHNNLYDYSLVKYKSIHDKVEIICHIHGKFNQLAYCHLDGQGCPKCKSPKGEKEILKYLNFKNIEYKFQKKILVNDTFFIYDFYLPKYNLFIEYDGEQHFMNIKFFGGIKRLSERINNDFQKDKYCLLNDINILRIPHWDFKNIENLLNNYFSILL